MGEAAYSGRIYMCSDLKSYYASQEAVARGLDPLTVNLLVADETRSDNTICLAVSPNLKALGVPARPRLFEAKQAIRLAELRTHRTIDYIIAPPRMAEYIRTSALIYRIYLKYVSPADAHVYSIDEAFFDLTGYLHLYREQAGAGTSKGESLSEKLILARRMAMTMIRDVLKTTGITATVGIGTNLYLAKIAMDIVAKRQKPDPDGVRIAFLDEEGFRRELWDHRPLTDFWQIGSGTAGRLAQYGIRTMGEIAETSLRDEEFFYRVFGVDGELLIDHSWGIETARMEDIKRYRPAAHSLTTGQVLPRPYRFEEARVVFREMADLLSAELREKRQITDHLTFYVGFDHTSAEDRSYTGPVCPDFYGRMVPRHVGGTVRLRQRTSGCRILTDALSRAFDEKVDSRLLVRRLGIAANNTRMDDGSCQLDLFTDQAALDREQRLRDCMLRVNRRYGKNALLRGANYLEGGTARERNLQIGGHRS